jgi:hypothetical protein
MKKFTFALMLAAVLMFAAAPLFAEGNMMFGVKAGLNMANLSGDDVSNTKIKMGVIGGAFGCYNINEIFAVQLELLYTMKGAGIDIPVIDASIKADYFEIPLLLKVNMPTEGKIKPSIYAGPAIGFLMSAKAEAMGASVDIKDYFKSTNFGIVAGAGVGYEMEKSLIFLEARYEVGLTTIAKENAGTISFDDEEESTSSSTTTPDVKTSDISILVGYGFKF